VLAWGGNRYARRTGARRWRPPRSDGSPYNRGCSTVMGQAGKPGTRSLSAGTSSPRPDHAREGRGSEMIEGLQLHGWAAAPWRTSAVTPATPRTTRRRSPDPAPPGPTRSPKPAIRDETLSLGTRSRTGHEREWWVARTATPDEDRQHHAAEGARTSAGTVTNTGNKLQPRSRRPRRRLTTVRCARIRDR